MQKPQPVRLFTRLNDVEHQKVVDAGRLRIRTEDGSFVIVLGSTEKDGEEWIHDIVHEGGIH